MRDQLEQRLRPVQKRLRLQCALRYLVPGSIAGAALGVVLLVYRLAGGTVGVSAYFAAVFVPPFLSALAGLFEEQSCQRAAHEIDRVCRLQDRTLSALEFASAGESPLLQLQVEDAISNLQNVRPATVVRLHVPRAAVRAMGVAVLTAVSLWPAAELHSENQSPRLSAATVAAATDAISEELQKLEQAADDADSEELHRMIRELNQDLESLKNRPSTVRKALATVSQMQLKMQQAAAMLDTETVDRQLAEVAEALAAADEYQAAAKSMQNHDYRQAAEQVQRPQASDLDSAEATAVADKLEKAALDAQKKNLDELSDVLRQMSTAVKKQDDNALAASSDQFAEQLRHHDVNRKVNQALKSRNEALDKTKRLLAADSRSAGNGAAANARGQNAEKGQSDRKQESASRKAGAKSAGNIDGEKTRLQSERQMAELTGQLGEEGDSDKETIRAADSEQTARRLAQQTYAEYRKMSEAVLESDPIPHGQREVIRRYFELIRPQQTETSESESSP